MEVIIAIITSVFASSGLWAFITAKSNKKTVLEEGVKALLHDRIYSECERRLRSESITRDEYENLQYLYKPYRELGGNGTCERLMMEINKLPIKGESL